MFTHVLRIDLKHSFIFVEATYFVDGGHETNYTKFRDHQNGFYAFDRV